MNQLPTTVSIRHNKAPNRIRFAIPLIRHKATLASMLKQLVLKDVGAKGIYHAEPNIVTGTLLVKYHPALHAEAEVVERVRASVQKIADGSVEISQKHKDPRVSRMPPQAYFTRELLVSVAGNVAAGLVLAAITWR